MNINRIRVIQNPSLIKIKNSCWAYRPYTNGLVGPTTQSARQCPYYHLGLLPIGSRHVGGPGRVNRPAHLFTLLLLLLLFIVLTLIFFLSVYLKTAAETRG